MVESRLIQTMQLQLRTLWFVLFIIITMSITPYGVIAQGLSPQDSILFEKLNSIDFIEGPASVDISTVAEIDIPAEYYYTGREGCRVLMEYFGNPLTNLETGYIETSDEPWYIVFEYDDIGYVRDDEKEDLDADAILEQIKEATDKGNVERRKKGFSTMKVLDWVTPPHYNDISNNLEWAFRGLDSDGNYIVNYNCRVLGRYGVMNVIFVVEPDSLVKYLPSFRRLLDTYSFKAGRRHAEYRKGDKIAEYGLTGLIVGGGAVAAAKGGLFKWLWKLIVAGFAAASAFLKKIWSKIKRDK